MDGDLVFQIVFKATKEAFFSPKESMPNTNALTPLTLIRSPLPPWERAR